MQLYDSSLRTVEDLNRDAAGSGGGGLRSTSRGSTRCDRRRGLGTCTPPMEVVHQHVLLPFDMKTGKALLDLPRQGILPFGPARFALSPCGQELLFAYEDTLGYEQSSILEGRLPVRATLDVIRGRWKPRFCRISTEAPNVFSPAGGAAGGHGASPHGSLRQLEADGVVARTVYPEVPARVEMH